MGKNQNSKKKSTMSLQEQLLNAAIAIGIDEEEIDNLSSKEISNDIKSPYNFVRLDQNIGKFVAYEDELPDQSWLNNRFNNGFIDFEIETTAPLLVSSGKSEDNQKVPMKDSNGNYIIPGSTFRGLIRQNCKILSLSNIDSDIDGNKYLTYRDIASNTQLNKNYVSILNIKPLSNGKKGSAPLNVKAGYISIQNNEYIIEPAKEINDKSYYTIHEGDLLAVINKPHKIDTMYKDMRKKFEFNTRNDFLEYYKKSDRSCENKYFKPYFINNVDFKFNQDGLSEVKVDEGQGSLLCSGFIREKKRHILINPIDTGLNKITIPKERIDSYNNYLKVNKIIEKNSVYYKLPDENEVKPCFFIEYNGKIYFGFTPYLRLFFNYPIKDGIPNIGKKKNNCYDWTESIFGFSKNDRDEKYRSRVSFCDIKATKAELEKYPTSLILGSPKPTFYKYYIQQHDNGVESNGSKKDLNTYNNNNFRIRGFKNYWIKSEIDKIGTPENKKIQTTFIPIAKGAIFKGKIYFNQLTKEEIGLILLAIKINKNAEYNMGMAKPYGYGSFKITDITLSIEDLDLKYGQCIVGDYVKEYKNNELDFFADSYKKIFEKKTNQKFDENVSIKEFVTLKTYKALENESERFKYLTLKEHNKTGILPSPLEYKRYIKKIK